MTIELAPAIPLEQLHPALESHVFGLTKIRAFRADEGFLAFQYRFQQISRVIRFFAEYNQVTRCDSFLTRAFEVHPTVVTHALKHSSTVTNIQAKAGLLLSAEEEVIIQWIRLNLQKARRTNLSQIRGYARETFKNFGREDGSIRLYSGTKANSGKHSPDRKEKPDSTFSASFLCTP
jgi:hypothetical protein